MVASFWFPFQPTQEGLPQKRHTHVSPWSRQKKWVGRPPRPGSVLMTKSRPSPARRHPTRFESDPNSGSRGPCPPWNIGMRPWRRRKGAKTGCTALSFGASAADSGQDHNPHLNPNARQTTSHCWHFHKKHDTFRAQPPATRLGMPQGSPSS